MRENEIWSCMDSSPNKGYIYQHLKKSVYIIKNLTDQKMRHLSTFPKQLWAKTLPFQKRKGVFSKMAKLWGIIKFVSFFFVRKLFSKMIIYIFTIDICIYIYIFVLGI